MCGLCFHRSFGRREQASERVCERVRECECVWVVFSIGLSGEGNRRASEQGNTLFPLLLERAEEEGNSPFSLFLEDRLCSLS